MSDGDDSAVGWEAIDEALEPIYGDQQPHHWGTVVKYMLGGPDPLDGISVYRQTEPVPHFHYVTYGFSELYSKESEDEEHSGWGFEMTFRLSHDLSVDEPPAWPASVLQNLARYVYSSGNAFDENHHLPCNSPIALEEDTKITCIALIADPQLPEIDTPHGKVKFLQMVGLCDDEYELVKDGYFNPVVDRVKALQPLAVTDIFRDSILDDESVRAEIESEPPVINQCESYGTHIEWTIDGDDVHLQVGATRVKEMLKLMKHVLGNVPIAIYGKNTAFAMYTEDANGFDEKGEGWLDLKLTQQTVDEICQTLQPTRDTHKLNSYPGLTIEIVPVEIKDRDGKTQDVVG